jgi:hypothetical protein
VGLGGFVDLISAYAIILMGFLGVGVWWAAYGRCKACNLDRNPRCGCDPDNKRKPWRNSGK